MYVQDENLAHCSFEAGILEDPDTTPPSDMWKLTADPILSAADEPEDITIEFEKGIPIKINASSIGTETEPTKLFIAANKLARKHGVGRIDIVENRLIGLKSRGAYETPGNWKTLHFTVSKLTLYHRTHDSPSCSYVCPLHMLVQFYPFMNRSTCHKSKQS